MHTTLPRKFYADPEFYRAELERFYFNRWICAGRADQIPNAGDYFTRTLGDESVIVTRDASGRRPVYGGTRKFQEDPHWRDLILFYEYFHGDDGSGLGASHQTGWTALVASLIDEWRN